MPTARTRIPTAIVDNPSLDAALADPPPPLPAIREVVAEPIDEDSAAFADAWRAVMQDHGARAYLRAADIRTSAGYALTTPSTDTLREVFGADADVRTIHRHLQRDGRKLRDYEAAVETLLAPWACDQRTRLSAQRAAHYLRQRDRHLDADDDPTRTP